MRGDIGRERERDGAHQEGGERDMEKTRARQSTTYRFVSPYAIRKQCSTFVSSMANYAQVSLMKHILLISLGR